MLRKDTRSTAVVRVKEDLDTAPMIKTLVDEVADDKREETRKELTEKFEDKEKHQSHMEALAYVAAKELTSHFKSPAIIARTEYDYFDSLNTMNSIFLNAIRGVAVFMAVGGMAVPGTPLAMTRSRSSSEEARLNCPRRKSTPGMELPSGPWQAKQLLRYNRAPFSTSVER